MKGVKSQNKKDSKPYADFSCFEKRLNIDLWCKHCEHHGNVKENYFKLVGYPKGHKLYSGNDA